MVEAGFLDEVRTLMARPGFDENLPSMRAVGYRQAIAYLKGDTDFKQFLESGKMRRRGSLPSVRSLGCAPCQAW